METLLAALVEEDSERDIYKEFVELMLQQTSRAKANAMTWSRLKANEIVEFSAIETLAFHMSLQLNLLEKRGFTLLFWQVKDIMVVRHGHGHGEFYLLGNLAQMVPLVEKASSTNLLLTYPTVFPLPVANCAPEVLKMAALPFITHRSASYYSLGLLCLELLKRINLSLDSIRRTKLFYFVERCLKEDPNERQCFWL